MGQSSSFKTVVVYYLLSGKWWIFNSGHISIWLTIIIISKLLTDYLENAGFSIQGLISIWVIIIISTFFNFFINWLPGKWWIFNSRAHFNLGDYYYYYLFFFLDWLSGKCCIFNFIYLFIFAKLKFCIFNSRAHFNLGDYYY